MRPLQTLRPSLHDRNTPGSRRLRNGHLKKLRQVMRNSRRLSTWPSRIWQVRSSHFASATLEVPIKDGMHKLVLVPHGICRLRKSGEHHPRLPGLCSEPETGSGDSLKLGAELIPIVAPTNPLCFNRFSELVTVDLIHASHLTNGPLDVSLIVKGQDWHQSPFQSFFR